MGLEKIKHCPHCNSLYEDTRQLEMCPTCFLALEKKFNEVRRFIRENEEVGIDEVSIQCDVSPKQILKWVRQERLIFSDKADVGIDCLACGVTIRTGKYCVACHQKLTRDLVGVIGRKKVEQEPERLSIKRGKGMHLSFY